MTRWATKPLGEVCELKNGRPFKPTEWEDKGLPIIRIQNLNDTSKHFNYTSREYPERFKVKRGDVLLSWSGTPGTSFGCFRWQGSEGWLNQHIFNVLLNGEFSPDFFVYQINSKLNELIAKAHGGVGLQHVTKGALSSLKLSVPPLQEQERIIKLLDEAGTLRKLRTQADRRAADLIPAIFQEMFGDPTRLEKMRWPFKPVSEFAEVSYGLADKLDASTKPKDGTRILTISNVLLNGSLDTRVEKYSIVEPTKRAKAQLQKHDLLFNWRNGSEEHIGKTAIWEGQIEGEILHVSFLLKIRPDSLQANPYFLWTLLNRLRATGFFIRNARMQINRKFNASELSALKLPLPPLSLQESFAARVAEIRAMEERQYASRHRLDDLFQSLLDRAFKGKL